MSWVRRAAPWSINNLAGQLQAPWVPPKPLPWPSRVAPALGLRGSRARPPDQRHRKRALFLNLEAWGRPGPLSGSFVWAEALKATDGYMAPSLL